MECGLNLQQRKDKIMAKYSVICRIGDSLIMKTIECREMSIKDGSYCFWSGEYGKTNRLLWAFPIMFTIVEGIHETK